MLTGVFLASAEERNVYGGKNISESALIGIFYDLKQTQDGKATNVDPDHQYWEILDEFFSKGWEEQVLNRYYRVTLPLFTTQIYIPDSNADLAPKAFGAGANVKPSRWVIHYKGQVSPPANGRYRFYGCSDDLIAVALDGKTVLLVPLYANPRDVFPKTNWNRNNNNNPEGPWAANSRLRAGDWMELKSDQIYDLDILIGERPGGQFNAFLMIEKQGEHYQMTNDGPVLPIFQVAPYETPVTEGRRGTAFARGASAWKSYQ